MATRINPASDETRRSVSVFKTNQRANATNNAGVTEVPHDIVRPDRVRPRAPQDQQAEDGHRMNDPGSKNEQAMRISYEPQVVSSADHGADNDGDGIELSKHAWQLDRRVMA